MATLSITNNTPSITTLSDPRSGFYITVPGGVTKEYEVTVSQIEGMSEALSQLRSRVLTDGTASFIIDVRQNRSDAEVKYQAATADVTRYLANRVCFGLAATNGTTPSVVATRRVNIGAGEAFVDGLHFLTGALVDQVGAASLLKTGAALVGSLTAAKDRYAHLCLVKNINTVQIVFIYGDEADGGAALPLSKDALASAVGAYLAEATPVYAFVEIATILFSEDAGLTTTVVNRRPVPSSYD